ncbi:MAG: nucleotidyltransferase domain-containing protein [Anaerolineae bacterium]
MKNPAQFPDLNELLNDFTAAHQEILGDNLIGVYLQGSAAVGDMDVYSDVDFIVVIDHPLNEHELADLQQITTRFFDRRNENHWAEHLEGSYFPIDVLQAIDQPEVKLIFNDNGSPELNWDTHCNTLVVRWCLREYGIALVGPAADTLLDPIPADLLKDEIREVMVDWGEGILARGHDMNCFYQQFVPASYCRMLHTLATGRVYSKPDGIAWARENLEPGWADLFDQITAERDDGSVLAHKRAEPADAQRTLDFIEYACSQIEANPA